MQFTRPLPTSPGRLASPAIVLLIAGVPIVLKTAMGRWQEATLPAPAVRLSRVKREK